MADIGLFFGTDSGTTRLIGKKIARALGKKVDAARLSKPLNVNRASAQDFQQYPALILGTPTYGEGVLPGKANKTSEESWLEFLPRLQGVDFSGVRIALYGLGDQEEYPDHFLSAMRDLYDFFSEAGGELVGGSDTDGFTFSHSRAVIDSRFIGLALDQHLQHLLTDQRIDRWLDEVLPLLLPDVSDKRAATG